LLIKMINICVLLLWSEQMSDYVFLRDDILFFWVGIDVLNEVIPFFLKL
jgi:hypothetical protein